MNRPLGLRFALSFVAVYFASRFYAIVRFAPFFIWDYAIWLVVSSLVVLSLLWIIFGKVTAVVFAATFTALAMTLEVASIFSLVQLAGPEGTPIELEVLYILGLALSIAGILHPSTKNHVSAK